ncbi:MAG: DUF4337 domain-containing protein [Candidatus Competibacteraceae bacterium]
MAITITLIATFMGICKIKDDNIVQAMQQAQADRVDHWGYYQAHNIRQDIAQATLDQLQAAMMMEPSAARDAYQKTIATYQELIKDQADKKTAVKTQAEADQHAYDALNYRDDQFDLSDAFLAIAISMLAITALTKKRWLYGAALVPTALGTLMGLAGLFGWPIHPDFLIRWLS